MMDNTFESSETADHPAIVKEYYDAGGSLQCPSTDVKERLSVALGNPPVYKFFQPIYVIEKESHPPFISLPLDDEKDFPAAGYSASEFRQSVEEMFFIEDEKGNRTDLHSRITEVKERSFQLRIDLPPEYDIGYFHICMKSDPSLRTMLVISPEQCHSLIENERKWGFSAQLYALRSLRSYGIGDFEDLRNLIQIAHRLGAGVIGINPVHAPFMGDASRISPYYSSHRGWLNWIYIAPDRLPEWKLTDEGLDITDHPSEEPIPYDHVIAEKQELLKILFDRFEAEGPLHYPDRVREFESFIEEGERSLRTNVLFDLLYEKLQKGDSEAKKIYACGPDSIEAKEFAGRHEKRLRFYCYLQWCARKQLEDVAHFASELGISLYLDLAVGAAPDGAEVWSDRDVFAAGARIGAPPDPFAPGGQDWGLVPFHPDRLREFEYAPFIRLLRASMLRDGIIRMDHVMGLFRLFWVVAPRSGGYVSYHAHELLSIVALESVRNHCMIIGEDLGTVPPGVREEMKRRNMLSWKVLYFEREGDGFIDPVRYDNASVATVNTHDLPTLAGYWTGVDLALRHSVGLLSDDMLERMRVERSRDRVFLLKALHLRGLIHTPEPDKISLEELIIAVHRFLSEAGSRIILYSIHDLLGDTRQPNLPGTVHEYPNWSLPYPVQLEKLEEEPIVKRLFSEPE